MTRRPLHLFAETTPLLTLTMLAQPTAALRDTTAALRSPSEWLWGVALVVLATPMLVSHVLDGVFLGPDAGLIRSSVMLAELTVVLGWAVCAHEVRLPHRSGPGDVLGALWVLSSVAATLTATHPVPAMLRSAEWATHGLFAIVLWMLFRQDESRLAGAQRALALGFVAVTALVVVAAMKMEDPGAHNWGSMVPYLGNIRYFGMYALAGAAFSCRWLLDPTASRRAGFLATAGLALGWAVLIWTGGRGTAGAMLVVGALMWWMAGTRRRPFATSFGLALVAGVVLSMGFPVEKGAGGVWRILNYGGVKGPGAEISNGRVMLWEHSLNAWSAQPWLGLGPDAGSFLLAPFGHFQPHNFIIQALTDWGVLGGVPFLVLVGWVFAKACRGALREERGAPRASRTVATAFLLGATAHALVDGYLYDARCLLLVAAATAMALQPANAHSKAADRAEVTSRWFSRWVRRWVGGVAGVIIVLTVLHIATVRAVWAPGIPEPHASRVALLKVFPSPSHLRETARWARAWALEAPDEALELARWGQRHSRIPWYYLRLEGDVLLQRGSQTEAIAAYKSAEQLETRAGVAAR